MKIYHNPRCRKSREGVQYLIDKRLNFEIIDYLNEGISEKNLKSIRICVLLLYKIQKDFHPILAT